MPAKKPIKKVRKAKIMPAVELYVPLPSFSGSTSLGCGYNLSPVTRLIDNISETQLKLERLKGMLDVIIVTQPDEVKNRITSILYDIGDTLSLSKPKNPSVRGIDTFHISG